MSAVVSWPIGAGVSTGLRPYTAVEMDDREKRISDLREHLASMTEAEREEVRTFLARFEAQVERKTQQLLYELSDPARVSESDLQMRDRLIAGFVPLIDDRGQLIYRKREELTLQDTRRFGKFMDADAERRKREILTEQDVEAKRTRQLGESEH